MRSVYLGAEAGAVDVSVTIKRNMLFTPGIAGSGDVGENVGDDRDDDGDGGAAEENGEKKRHHALALAKFIYLVDPRRAGMY